MSILFHHFIILLLSLSSAVAANHANGRKGTKEDDHGDVLVQQKRQRQQHRQQQSMTMMKCKKKNEQFTECASSTCFEESCGEDVLFAKPIPKRCTKDCKRGCQCKPGFYRNHDGRCVDEFSCIMCGYGEDWTMTTMGINEKSSSSSGSSNPSVIEEKTCAGVVGMDIESDTTSIENSSNINNSESFEHGSRSGDGNSTGGRCVCGENLYRTDDGLCVTEQTCRLCTGKKNEIFQQCGSSSCWEYTCDDVYTPLRERLMRFCTEDCVSGCKCHFGFYRNTQTGECVSAESCRGANKK